MVDQYALTDWPGLLDLLHTHGPDRIVDLARCTEQSDPHGHTRPRPKLHDDATIAYCLLSPEDEP